MRERMMLIGWQHLSLFHAEPVSVLMTCTLALVDVPELTREVGLLVQTIDSVWSIGGNIRTVTRGLS